MSFTVFLSLLMATFLCIAFVLAVVMGRLGHSAFAWGLLGLVLGPIALVVALVTVRDTRPWSRLVASGVPGGELERQAEAVRAWLQQEDLPTQARPTVSPELVLRSGQPAQMLDRIAAEGGYGLLAVGARGAGLSRVVLGSVATKLAAGARVPVLIVSDQAQEGPGEHRLRPCGFRAAGCQQAGLADRGWFDAASTR